MYGFILLLHVVGWGFFLHYRNSFGLAYAGAGTLAYTFGLRHAFDADHIAAVDDTTRYLMQRGKKPLGVGFFFSLGHSTIVFLLSFGLAIAANVHAYAVGAREHAFALALSLAIWPITTALPAFVAALVAAIFFDRVLRRGAPSGRK